MVKSGVATVTKKEKRHTTLWR